MKASPPRYSGGDAFIIASFPRYSGRDATVVDINTTDVVLVSRMKDFNIAYAMSFSFVATMIA